MFALLEVGSEGARSNRDPNPWEEKEVSLEDCRNTQTRIEQQQIEVSKCTASGTDDLSS